MLKTQWFQCIEGFKNHDSEIGIYAPEAEAYTVFAPIFDPIIEDYHMGFKCSDKHPEKDWGDVNAFDDLDPEVYDFCRRSKNDYNSIYKCS